MDLITQPLILEALAEGGAKGKAEGRADMLLHPFRQRFGAFPEGVEVKVGSAPLPGIWRRGRMPRSMHESLTMSSEMEAQAERRTCARETVCVGIVRSEIGVKRMLRIGQHAEIHNAPKREGFPDLAEPVTAGPSQQCLSRDHGAEGATQSWQRICRLEVPGSRPAHQAEVPLSINAKRLTH